MEFIKKILLIKNINLKLFWPVKKINLFYETSKENKNFLNLERK